MGISVDSLAAQLREKQQLVAKPDLSKSGITVNRGKMANDNGLRNT